MMEGDIFNYVNEFPNFKGKISNESIESDGLHKEKCEGFMSEKISDYTDASGNFLTFCAKTVKYSTQLASELNSNKLPFCMYLNYWIYNEVISKDETKYNNSIINGFLDHIDNLETCENHTKSIDKNIHENLQILYKLYEDFKKIKEETLTDSNDCKSEEKCAQYYKSQEDKCKGKDNNSFCNALENFRVKFNDHLRSKNECKEIEELPSFQGPSLAATISLPVSVMSYTPFGPWIRHRLSRSTKMKNKRNQEIQESGYTSGYQDMPYLVSYQSSRHS
ncbi:VIR protein [Plasmodium vivax]|uniref:VIR protein n=1 Tax=Plasmodium vivax TaxID=5855 RepID=A0A1G4E1V9_PLAVI|nr:VIR protein [Plasmodium vivax]